MIKVLILTIAFSLPLQAEVVDRILVIVNDDIITQSDVAEFKKKLKAGKIQDELYDIDPKNLLKDRDALLQHMISEEIIESEIKRKGLEVTKEAVEKEIETIMRRNQINKNQLRQALKNEGTNYADYFDFIKNRMERQAIIQQSVTSKIRITEEDIEDYYLKKYGENKETSFRYELSHILFDSMEEAKKTYQALQAGASFSEVAQRQSKDESFSSGGYLGKFKSGEMAKPIEDAVKKKSEGEITSPVKTAAGIHIFKVNSKKLIANQDLEEKKPQIRSILTQQALKEQFQFWLDQKRKETYIRINS